MKVVLSRRADLDLMAQIDQGRPTIVWLGMWGDLSHDEYTADGTRYQLSQMETQVIRSGFEYPGTEQTVGGMINQMALESNPSSLAHRIPPGEAEVRAILESASLDRHLVIGTGRFDVERAPLVPAAAS